MNRFARKGLVAAMEDGDLEGLEGGEIAGADADVAAADAVGETAEQEIVVNEETTAIEALSFAIEEAVEDIETVEEIADTVEEVSDAGGEGGEGLTEGEAVLAEEALSIVYRRLGIRGDRVMPATESFRSANSRKAATRIGLEGIGETIKSVWEKIIAAIRSMWSKIVAFVKKLTDANVGLEKAAKALKEKLKKSKAKVPASGDSEFDDAGLYALFPTGKKVDAGVVKGFLTAHSSVASQAGKLAQSVHATQAIVTGLAGGKKSVPEFAKMAEQSVGFAASAMVGKTVSIDTSREEGVEATSDVMLVGGKAFEVKAVLYTPSGDDESDQFSLTHSVVDHDKAETSPSKIDIGTQSELAGVCDAVIAFAKDNGKMVRELEKTDKEVKNLLKELDNVFKTIENDDAAVKANRRPFMLARKVVAGTVNKLGAFGTTYAGMNVKCGRAALRYVSACAAKY